jgi:hypothetical protein
MTGFKYAPEFVLGGFMGMLWYTCNLPGLLVLGVLLLLVAVLLICRELAGDL